MIEAPGVWQLLLYYTLFALTLGVLGLTGLAVNTFLFRRSGWAEVYAPNAMLGWAFHLTTGWSVWILVLLILAFGQFFFGPVIFAAAVCMAACSFVYLQKIRYCPDWPVWNVRNLITYLPFLILGLAISLLAFRVPGLWDDTMYHLPYARFILEQHGLAVNPYLRFPLFPQHLHLVFAYGLAAGSTVFVQLLNLSFPIIIVFFLGGLGKELGGNYLLGILVALIFLSIDQVQQIMPYAYVDMGYTLFCTAAAVSIYLWFRYRQESWLWISAIAGGSAIGTKYFAIAFIGILAGMILISSRSVHKFLIYIVIVCCVGGFWYLRNVILSGDPFHPLGGPVFGFYLWDPIDLEGQMATITRNFGGSLIDTLPSLVEMNAYLFILGLAIIVLYTYFSPGMTMLWGVTTGYCLIWGFFLHGDRYLLPALPIGCLLGGWGLQQIVRTLIQRSRFKNKSFEALGLLGVGLFSLFMVGANVQEYMHKARAGFEEPLKAKPGYKLIRKANEYADQYGHRLYQLGFENLIFFFDGQVVGDWFGPGRYYYVKQPGEDRFREMDVIRDYLGQHEIQLMAVNAERFNLDISQLRQYTQVLYEDNHGILVRVDTSEEN